jgi:glutathione S-transferase
MSSLGMSSCLSLLASTCRRAYVFPAGNRKDCSSALPRAPDSSHCRWCWLWTRLTHNSALFTPLDHHLHTQVMKARKDCDVHYPNLYATPGYHKMADKFNRVQRGHQSMFETFTSMTVMGLIGGIKHPIAAAIAGVAYNLGCVLYMMGYADTSVDVDTARHSKGGPIKMLGMLLRNGQVAVYWWFH